MRDDFGGLFAAAALLRRDPTASEVLNGIPCGPFDQKLLNEMYFAESSMLSELNTILDAAGIVPDETLTNQLLAAIQSIASGSAGASALFGNCYLSKSGSNLKLAGRALYINGQYYSIPLAGVSLTAPGIANTSYYIYAYMNAGTLTLEASATGHAPSGTVGNEIKTGDATRSLVGAGWTDGSGAWLGAASWFNRKRRAGTTGFTANRSTTSTSLVELNSEIRNTFWTWSDETVLVSMGGACSSSNNYTNGYNYKLTALAFDGTTPEPNQAVSTGSYNGNDPIPLNLFEAKTGLAEGLHYATMLGAVQTATGTWYAANNLAGTASAPTEACTITVIVNG